MTKVCRSKKGIRKLVSRYDEAFEIMKKNRSCGVQIKVVRVAEVSPHISRKLLKTIP